MNKIINIVAFIVFIVISVAAAQGYISSTQSKYFLVALLVVFSVFYYRDKIISGFKNKK